MNSRAAPAVSLFPAGDVGAGVGGDRLVPASELEAGRRSNRIRGIAPECRGLSALVEEGDLLLFGMFDAPYATGLIAKAVNLLTSNLYVTPT